jgi:hypothetical protein
LARSTPLTASFDWIFQWRESSRDGVYAVPGFLIIPAGKSDARFVGNRPGTEVRWQATRHLWFQADYGMFYAGKFVKESQPARNLNYWALWAGYRFQGPDRTTVQGSDREGQQERATYAIQFGRFSFFKNAANRGSPCKFFSRGSTFVRIRPVSRCA